MLKLPFQIIAILVFSTVPLSAESISEICVRLIESRLIDKSSSSTLSQRLSSEFNYVCEFEAAYESRYRSSSNTFKAVYDGFKGGATHSGGRQSLAEQIDWACKRGARSFANYVMEESSESIGSNLARSVTECAEIAARENREAFYGTTSVPVNDEGFGVDIRYVPGSLGAKYRLDRINIDGGEKVECYTGLSERAPVEGMLTLSGESSIISFTCSKPKGSSISGSFTFSTVVSDTTVPKSVRFEATSRDVDSEIAAEVERRVLAVTSNLRNEVFSAIEDKASLGRLNVADKISMGGQCFQPRKLWFCAVAGSGDSDRFVSFNEICPEGSVPEESGEMIIWAECQ
ncbi:hypothetical protein IWQ49_006433 [Labrenzia sp. EL_126]|nr:hypothetical protein [Labrenzia sp. EL_126]